MGPPPDSLALKWFFPGTRATIFPRRVRRRRFEKDLFDFIKESAGIPHAVGPVCPKSDKTQIPWRNHRSGPYAPLSVEVGATGFVGLGVCGFFAGSRSMTTERPFGPFCIASATR